MINDPQDQPDGMALVMPFVICQSKGGPFEDDAFVAGYECGGFDKALGAIAAVGGDGLSFTAHTSSLPQLELIAMHHGFLLEVDEFDDLPEWSLVTAERPIPR